MRWCRDENQLDASGRHRRPSQRPLLRRGARTNLPPSVPTLGPALSHRFSSGTFSLSPGTRNVVPSSLWGVRCSMRFSKKLGRLASLPPVSQGRQSAGDTRGHRRGGRRLPRARRGPWTGRPRPEPGAGLAAGGGGGVARRTNTTGLGAGSRARAADGSHHRDRTDDGVIHAGSRPGGVHEPCSAGRAGHRTTRLLQCGASVRLRHCT